VRYLELEPPRSRLLLHTTNCCAVSHVSTFTRPSVVVASVRALFLVHNLLLTRVFRSPTKDLVTVGRNISVPMKVYPSLRPLLLRQPVYPAGCPSLPLPFPLLRRVVVEMRLRLCPSLLETHPVYIIPLQGLMCTSMVPLLPLDRRLVFAYTPGLYFSLN